MFQGVTLRDTSLLCVEPTSGQTFSINMGTQECSPIHLDAATRIDNKIARDRYKVDYLLDRQEQESKWQFSNPTVENYRRMMVPFYLLEEECNPYPNYVDNSTINMSLTSSHQLKRIKISLSESVIDELKYQERKQDRRIDKVKQSFDRRVSQRRSGQIEPSVRSGSSNGGAKQAISGTQNEKPVRVNISREIFIEEFSLLSSADSLIQQVEQRLEALSNHNFATSKRIQLLKFDGIDSFLYGDTQLIYFNDIREHLSSKVHSLSLVLLSFGEAEVTPGMYERHLAKLQERGISLRQGQSANVEFPPIVFKNQSASHSWFNSSSMMTPFAPHESSSIPNRYSSGGDSAKKSAEKSSEMRRSNWFSRPKGLNSGGIQKRSWYGNRPGSSSLLNNKIGGKTFSEKDQIATCFQRVTLFQWYRPKGLVCCEDVEAAQSYPFEQEYSSVISYSNQQRGCVPFLRGQSMVPMGTDKVSDILPSCMIMHPFEISLLSLNEVTQVFIDASQNSQPILMPRIKYIAPNLQESSTVSKFLAEVLQSSMAKKRNFGKSEVQAQLVNPLGNLGMNGHYTEGFSQFQFRVSTKKKDAPFQIKPKYVQLQAALYLGCKRLSVFSYSKLFPYQSKINMSQAASLQFWKKTDHIQIFQRQLETSEEMLLDEEEKRGDLINISSLPNCTRLCINVILLPENCAQIKNAWGSKAKQVTREGMVLGSCTMTLFDEKFLLRQGPKEFRLWPFLPFSARMVCQTECMKRYGDRTEIEGEITRAINLQVKLPEFPSRVGWRLDPRSISDRRFDAYKKSAREVNEDVVRKNTIAKLNRDTQKKIKSQLSGTVSFTGYAEELESNVDVETENLMQVKKLLDAYPMELSESQASTINLQNVLSNSDFIQKLPIYIKLVDFTNPTQVQTCYQMLENSQLAKDMKPDEALVLLDGQFSDIKVRIFAVQKLSQLNDYQIALIMPQLVQALKYELFHHSPLAEFLLEKALRNLRVVGHAFYWALKANLWCEQSLERLFVILERFLMCCGGFKNDLLRQNLVNESLIKLSAFVNHKLDVEKFSKKLTVQLMHKELAKHALRIKMTQQLLIAHGQFDDLFVQAVEADENRSQNDSMQEKFSLMLANRKQTMANFSNYRKRTVISKLSAHSLKSLADTQASGPKMYRFNIEEINAFIEDSLAALDNQQEVNSVFQNVEVNYQVELLYTPFAPKNPLKNFAASGGTIFLSKKKPLLIVADLADQQSAEDALKGYHATQSDKVNAEDEKPQVLKVLPSKDSPSFDGTMLDKTINETDGEQEEEVTEKKQQLKFLFKCGDDLRQDNLTLQFFKIMDGLWQKNSMNMEMECYDVMESGFETGFIEFIDGATVITDMHVDAGNWKGPFTKTSIMKFFLDKVAKNRRFTQASKKEIIEDRLQKYHWTFLKSLAGQCVATYVLGIRDRHPGNFMLHNETGKFFHIDFGHFLGHAKAKLGFKRDREPFIYSDELNYFLVNFGNLLVRDVKTDSPPVLATQLTFNSPSQVKLPRSAKKAKEKVKPTFTYEIYEFDKNQAEKQSKKEGIPLRQNRSIQQPRYSSNKIEEYFENLAVEAFITLRRNADIFVNLLILMLVAELEELDIKSIEFIKKALFLNVSEEEAAVNFRNVIMEARKQWYRPIDNLFHIISDRRKVAKREAAERKRAEKAIKQAQK